MTTIDSIATSQPDQHVIDHAAACLRDGQLVVFPTETVYGISADPQNEQAIQRIYEAKGRDFNKPVAYFVSDLIQIGELGAQLPPAAQQLAEAYWPGPLTLVLPGPEDNYLGFRMPDHVVPLALLNTFGRVLAVTSANTSGQPDALNAQQAVQAFGDKVAHYIDGGTVTGTQPSTVVKVDPDNTVTLLREGAIKQADILQTAQLPG